MSYLGNAPARSFISFERQVFTIVNSQTAYALSHSVTNENDIRLVVNNVVQEPGSGKAYTATGTALTLSAALTNGTDEMYCVFLGRATATSAPGAGSIGTAQLASDAVTNAKIADDAISDEQLDPTVITGQTAEATIATDDLILLSDTSASGALRKMTRANFVSGVAGNNQPYFWGRNASIQAVSDNTATKLNATTERVDSDNKYASSRFTPTEAGNYFIFGGGYLNSEGNGNLEIAQIMIYQNGSAISGAFAEINFRSNPVNQGVFQISTIIDMDSDDYVELYGQLEASDGTGGVSAVGTFFGGYKLI